MVQAQVDAYLHVTLINIVAPATLAILSRPIVLLVETQVLVLSATWATLWKIASAISHVILAHTETSMIAVVNSRPIVRLPIRMVGVSLVMTAFTKNLWTIHVNKTQTIVRLPILMVFVKSAELTLNQFVYWVI